MIFITGGVRSGKSAFAEHYAACFGKTKNYRYLATGVAFDEEMRQRIKRHQQDRETGHVQWQTLEMQVNFPNSVDSYDNKDVVLVECITTWLSNVLYDTEQEMDRTQAIWEHVEAFKQQLLRWKERDVKVIIVSNEILDEQASTYGEVNKYRQILGQLHQWIVYNSTEAYEVQFQLIQKWK